MERGPEVEKAIAGDPGANGGDCPSGCCPVTPVLRMKMITAPNDGVSFTSDNAENLIGLSVNLLPACLKESTNVTWQVADAPGDFINSGTPAQPTPGEVSSFRVFNSILPVEASGRALPLAYKVTASITRDGITNYANATVKQDEIDKCRQEYIDIPTIVQNVPDYMSKIGRDLFTLGLDGIFVDRRYVRDCYAHIYPSRAGEALRLISTVNPQLSVTSGYRSPRHNARISPRGAPGSSHMFGKGADVAFATNQITPGRMLDLWNAGTCPMILERNGRPIELLVCDSNGNMLQRYLDALNNDPDGDGVPEIFNAAVKLHLGE